MSRYIQLPLVAVLMLGTGLLIQAARADDLVPPPYRGAPRSLMAEWEFFTNANPASPEVYNFVLGPELTPPVGGGPSVHMGAVNNSMTWHPQDFAELVPANSGVWFANGTDTSFFSVPNFVDEEPVKHLRLQTTFFAPLIPGTTLPQLEPFIHDVSGVDPSGPVISMPMGSSTQFLAASTAATGLNYGLFHKVEDWKLFPNPDFERMTHVTPQGVGIAQFVIDTVSVPEPSTMGLLATVVVCGTVLARRRK